MNNTLLQKHIKAYLSHLNKTPEKHHQELEERRERVIRYQTWTRDKLLALDSDSLYEYIAPLWAMLIWGNKRYVTDKLIENNSLESVRTELAELIWGKDSTEVRWDRFRSNIKGVGPAMMSELLCFTHPEECAIWNRRAYIGLNYLGVPKLPRHNYQMTGKRYVEISQLVGQMAKELRSSGVDDANLLTVDYFIWDELQVEDNLSNMFDSE